VTSASGKTESAVRRGKSKLCAHVMLHISRNGKGEIIGRICIGSSPNTIHDKNNAVATQPTPVPASLKLAKRINLIKNDSGLDSTLVLHGFQTLRPLLELKCLVNNTTDLNLAGVKILDSGGEHVCFRE